MIHQMTVASIIAKLAPMETRGPAPNGISRARLGPVHVKR
jgi:hypothetical protein